MTLVAAGLVVGVALQLLSVTGKRWALPPAEPLRTL
jgi:hypothetical protein